MKRSGDPVIGRSGDRSEAHTPVILSGAPQQNFAHGAGGRGVEGPLHSAMPRSGIKAFSREFPDASFVVRESSGSFDSPSRLLGLAQDDSERSRFRELYTGARERLRDSFAIILATLREIFDESAYERFLSRTHARRSVVSYRAFLRENNAADNAGKPRCC